MTTTIALAAANSVTVSCFRSSLTWPLDILWREVTINNSSINVLAVNHGNPKTGWEFSTGPWPMGPNPRHARIFQGHSIFHISAELFGEATITRARLKFKVEDSDNNTFAAGDLYTFTQYFDNDPILSIADYIRVPGLESWATRGMSGSKLSNVVAHIESNLLIKSPVTVHTLELPLSVFSDLTRPIHLIHSLSSAETLTRPSPAATTLEKFRTLSDVILELDIEYVFDDIVLAPGMIPSGKVLAPRIKVIRAPAGISPTFDSTGIMQGAECVVAAGSIDINRDGESAGTARLNLHDGLENIGRWDYIQVLMGYGAMLVPRFYGRVNQLDRNVDNAMQGSVVSVACVGQTAEILQIETTTPIYSNAYRGFGNWNSTAIWTRSRIVEDLCRIYGIPRHVIEPSFDVVYQRPFVQMRLADIFAEIAVPDFARIGFNAKGEFFYTRVNQNKPSAFAITEGETLLNFQKNVLHEKVVNEVLVKGTSLDTVQIVQSQAVVGRYTRDIPPNTTFIAEKTQIEESFFDDELTHTFTVQLPTAYAPANVTGSCQDLRGAFSNASSWDILFPNPQNSTIMLPGAYSVKLNTASISGVAYNIAGNFVDVRFFIWAFYEGSSTAVRVFETGYVPSRTVRNLADLDVSAFVAAATGGEKMITRLRFTVFTSAFAIQTFQTSSYDITYQQVPGATGAITVTRNDAAIIAQRQMPKGTTTQYIFDVRSTFPSDVVKLIMEVRGRALRVATPELIFFTSRDTPSVNIYGSKSLVLEAASVSTIAEAKRIADAIISAGKADVETIQVECVGFPILNPAMFVDIKCINANPINHLGAAARKCYVLSVNDRFDISAEGYRWTQGLNLLPATRAALAIVRNFSLNPIKERAEIQSEFFSSFVHGQVVEVHDQKAFITGQPDPQRYTVEILSANGDPANLGQPFRVARIGNAANEQFVKFDTVSVIFQDGERTRPQIIARSHVAITNNAPIALLCSSIQPNGSGGARIVTNRRHNFAPGNVVMFAGTNSTPSLDGRRTVSAVISDTAFDVSVNVTVGGFTGSVNMVVT